MRPRLTHVAALLAALPLAASGQAGPDRAPRPAGVDMAIEWLPYVRPPLIPSPWAAAGPGSPPAPMLRAAWCLNDLPAGAGASTEPPSLRAEGCLHAAPAAPGQAQPHVWALNTADRRLSMALQRWSAVAGWQLVWEAERDFPIEASIELAGSLPEALEKVMNSLADSDYPLQAVMNAQTRVLRVRRQHDNPR